MSLVIKIPLSIYNPAKLIKLCLSTKENESYFFLSTTSDNVLSNAFNILICHYHQVILKSVKFTTKSS